MNREIGLEWSDYGFRFYDAVIGRFTGVDPISDQFPHLSTFNYASNDPILNIDLHGLQGVPFSYPTNGGTGAYSTYHYQSPMYGEAPDLLPLVEFVAGFTPIGAYIDGANVANDLRKGDFIGAGVAAVFLVPGSDIFKGGKSSMKSGLRKFISTEPGMQATDKINSFASDFKNAKNQKEFNEIFKGNEGSAKVIENPLDGETYIIDGHHRLKAAEKAGTGFTVPVENVELENTIFDSFQDIIDSSNNKDFKPE